MVNAIDLPYALQRDPIDEVHPIDGLLSIIEDGDSSTHGHLKLVPIAKLDRFHFGVVLSGRLLRCHLVACTRFGTLAPEHHQGDALSRDADPAAERTSSRILRELRPLGRAHEDGFPEPLLDILQDRADVTDPA